MGESNPHSPIDAGYGALIDFLSVSAPSLRGAARSALNSNGAAPIAQGIEQDGPNVKVGGSIPSGGTFIHHAHAAVECGYHLNSRPESDSRMQVIRGL